MRVDERGFEGTRITTMRSYWLLSLTKALSELLYEIADTSQ